MVNKLNTSFETKFNSRKFYLVFSVCWFSYAVAYFCRVNLSVSMPFLMEVYSWDKLTLGMIAGGFFWAYAAGQLVNGVIGDRFQPRFFVGFGMLVSGLANILIPIAGERWVLLLWTLNGFFQSMLWGPIVRTISTFTDDKNKMKVATALSTSFIFGSLAAYFVTGNIAQTSWRAAFWLPGAIMVFAAIIWVVLIRGKIISLTPTVNEKTKKGFFRFALSNGLLNIGVICLLHGIIKESIVVWGPMLLSETHEVSYEKVLGYFGIIPLTNFVGILFSGFLTIKTRGRTKTSLSILFTVSSVSSLLMFFLLSRSLFISLIFLIVISAMIFAINSILLSITPLNFIDENRVSSVAGILDFTTYLGAALATPMVGWIAEFGWNYVVILWTLILIAGGVFVRFMKKR